METTQSEDDDRLDFSHERFDGSQSVHLIKAFVMERVGLFSLFFHYQDPKSSELARVFVLSSNLLYILMSLMKPLFEVLGQPPFKLRIYALTGRSIFYIERCTTLLAAIYLYFGYRVCWILAAILFCFTNSVLIKRFVPLIEKTVKEWIDIMEAKLDLKENEELLKAKEKVEQKQEPVIEDKLPEKKVQDEIVEDKLPWEKVEFNQEPLEAEVVIDYNIFKLKQEPLKADLEDKLPPIREANGERINEYFVELNDEDEDGDYDDDDEDGNDHDEEEDEDEDDENDREEKEKEDEISNFEAVDCYKIFTEVESEKEPITDYKQQCLILEEENKDLNAKLAAASESLEHYLQIEKDFLEDRNKWEKEKQDILKDRNKWETEKNNLSEMKSWYQSWVSYYAQAANNYLLNNQNLLGEKNELSAKLHSANSSAEFYKAVSHKLGEERDNLSAKLFAHTNLNLNVVEVMEMKNRNLPYHYLKLEEKNRKLNKAEHNKEYYHNLVRVMEEKNRKVNEDQMQEKLKQLEKDKSVLTAKLAAAKSKSEFYLSYLQDRGF